MQIFSSDLWLSSLAFGMWMVAIGYYFLSFIYILNNQYLNKEKEDRQIYWLTFSLFFIFLGVGRAFYIISDFFSVPATSPQWNQFGAGMNWFAIGCLAVMGATMLLDNEKINNAIGILLVAPPFAIGSIYPFLPNAWLSPDSALYLLFNGAVLIIYVILIVWLFIYLAILIPGEIRKKSSLNALGFILWFAGRTINTQMVQNWITSIIPAPNGLGLLSIISSSLVLLALLTFSYTTS